MNMAYRFRIYPTREQENLLAKTFGCCRFLYNQMLSDKIREYEVSKKMLRNTPAMYKKEYPFLKEVDALALANVQLHLEKAYRNFFRDPKSGFPKFKSKHRSRKRYTTNLVNGNVQVEDYRIKLPKLTWIRMKKHRDIPEKYRLKSVTVSMDLPESIMQVFCMKYLTVRTKQEWIMKMQKYWGSTMRCVEWLCFQKI